MSATTLLTMKQESFCLAFIETGNASEAYRRTYSAGKMKAETINEAASRLLADSKVAARVKELRQEITARGLASAQRVLEEVSRLAFSDVSRLIGPGGKVLLPHELDEATRAAVKTFKIDEYGRIEYQFWDKNSALDKLFRHLGLYMMDSPQQGELPAALPPETVVEIVGRLQELRDNHGSPG